MKDFMENLKRSGSLVPIILCLIIGVLLIVFGSGVGDKSTIQTSADAKIGEDIRLLCEQVEGVSNVTVAVSLDQNGGVGGVGIVCRGGSDPEVQRRLISLVSSVWGVRASKIFITEAQK